MKNEHKNIDWHTGFISAIHLELADFKDYLEFHTEYPLSSKPLEIDCVIIKKPKDIVIDKNFASFFRETNIIEYKSPNSYLSVKDFYKVYAYVCLYSSLERGVLTEKTITFIVGHTPKKLIKYLESKLKFIVEEKSPGIYTVIGDIFPIQIIDNRKLSPEENIWLKDLTNKLVSSEWKNIQNEADKRKENSVWLKIYLDVITRANNDSFKEINNMGLGIVELLEEMGALDEMKEKGGKRRDLVIAKRLLEKGYPIDEIVSITDLEPEKVRELV